MAFLSTYALFKNKAFSKELKEHPLVTTSFRKQMNHSISNNRKVISGTMMNYSEWLSGKLNFRNAPSDSIINCIRLINGFPQVYASFRTDGYFFFWKANKTSFNHHNLIIQIQAKTTLSTQCYLNGLKYTHRKSGDLTAWAVLQSFIHLTLRVKMLL